MNKKLDLQDLRQDEVLERTVRIILQPLRVAGSKGVVVRVGGALRKVAAARVVGRVGARRVEALVAPRHFDGVGAAGPVRQIAFVERRCQPIFALYQAVYPRHKLYCQKCSDFPLYLTGSFSGKHLLEFLEI